MKIGFLGAGLMGTGFVRRMLKNGHQVRVWNRSLAKAKALEAEGATACATVAEAIDGVDRIHLILSDDKVVDGTLEPVAELIPAGTWIIDHSTTAPAPTGERAERWASRGRVYLHAPVMMSPQNAADAAGFMLVSGAPEQVARVMPDLEKMTGKVINLGAKPELAAAHKLIGNLAFLGMYGILTDIYRLAHATGLTAEEATSTFKHFNPGELLPNRAEKVAGGEYTPPDFTVTMARKDIRLMIETGAQGGADLRVMPQLAQLQDEAIGRGEGDLDTSAAFRFPLGGQ